MRIRCALPAMSAAILRQPAGRLIVGVIDGDANSGEFGSMPHSLVSGASRR